MRRKIHQQIPFMPAPVRHVHAKELAAASAALDEHPEVLASVLRDIVGKTNAKRGRLGMSADQVVRATVLMQLHDLSYEKLAYELADSATARSFCRIGVMEDPPTSSALQQNIKRVSAASWEGISRAMLGMAKNDRIETGRQARFDCTVTDTNI